nr:OmpA family protein [Deltaproteobacteria bacterium]
GSRGTIAAIIVSDGHETVGNAAKAAKAMKNRFGDRLCIYPVVIGDDPDGKKEMEEIARLGGCGFATDEAATRTNVAMADFVERVFLAKVGDQDGDGVLDPQDQCPNTPRGVRVDARGCPFPAKEPPRMVRVADTDGDGVPDNADVCPGTPRGANVDSRGCWTLRNVTFEFAKWDIKPRYYPFLDEVAEILQQNPSLRVQVQGHTDNIGTAKFNKNLSVNRAKSVIEYLTTKGISKNRMTPEGFGLTQPIATNDTPEGRAKNRRVHMKPVE